MDSIKQEFPALKLCSCCKQEFPATEEFFDKKKLKCSYGLRNPCKACRAKLHQANYVRHPKLVKDPQLVKVCACCKQEFPNTSEFFYVRKDRGKEYTRNQCISCVCKIVSINTAKNPEQKKAYNKEYHSKPDKKKKRSERDKRRKQTDLGFRIFDNLRKRIPAVLHGTLKSASSKKLFGCSSDFLVNHLETTFHDREDGLKMSLDNYGLHGWHVDHIRPCASFDFTDPEQQKQCFHWTNLQALWAEENMAKSDTYVACTA